MKISVRQVKAARALLGWSQADLSRHSGVSVPTIARLEAEDAPAGWEIGGRQGTVDKIRKALQDGGVSFTNGGEPGVKLKRRASRSIAAALRMEDGDQ